MNNIQEPRHEIDQQGENGLHLSVQKNQNGEVEGSKSDLDKKNAQNETRQQQPSDEFWSATSESDIIGPKGKRRNEKDEFEVSDSIINASHRSLAQRLSFGSRKGDSSGQSASAPEQDVGRRKEQSRQQKKSTKKQEAANNGNSNGNNRQTIDKSRIAPKLRFFKGYQPKKIYSLSDLLIKPAKKYQEQLSVTPMKSNETSKSSDKSPNHNEINQSSQNEKLEQTLALESFMSAPGQHPMGSQYPPGNSQSGFMHQRAQAYPYGSPGQMMGLNQPFMQTNLIGGGGGSSGVPNIGQEASVNHHLYHNPALALAYGHNHPQAQSHNLNQFHRSPRMTSEASIPMLFATGAQSHGSSTALVKGGSGSGQTNQSGAGNKNSTAALSAAAAAVLLGERAKALLNQMTMNNAAAVAAAAAAVAAKNSNLLADNGATSGASNSSASAMAPVAKAGPASIGSGAGEETINRTTSYFETAEGPNWPIAVGHHSSDALAGAPTMVLEHTDETAPLDFETQLVGGGTVHTRSSPEVVGDSDDDVTATFYSEPVAHSEKMTRELHNGRAHAHSHSHSHSHPHLHSHPHQHRLLHNPMDFYDDTTGEAPDIYTGVGPQSGGPHEEVGSYAGAYSRPPSPQLRHHDSVYPDSIDAIKGKSNAQPSRDDSKYSRDNLIGLVRDRLSASPTGGTEHIKDLIRELQALTSKVESDNNEANGTRKSSDKTGSSSSSVEFDDYDDLLGSKDSDEGDRRRALRRKIIAKIRAKYENQSGKTSSDASSGNGGGSGSGGNGGTNGGAGDSSRKVNDDSIRIPLHALLLAALDRRASSSEPSSSHIVLPDERDASNLVQDEQSKYLINDVQQQFADDTSGLGQLLNATKLIESSLISSATQQHQHQHQQNQATKSLVPLDGPPTLPTGPLNQSMNVTQFMEDAVAINSQPMQLVSVRATPTSGQTENTNEPKPQVRTVILQTHQLQPNKSTTTDARGSGSSGGGGSGDNRSNSGGDFDLDEQVEQYARDDRHVLEPAWMRRREDRNDYNASEDRLRARRSRNRNSRQRKSGGNTGYNANATLPVTDFEDDYGHMDQSARRKMREKLWSRFKKRPTRRHRTPPEPPNESSYLADGDRFIDEVSRDASDGKGSPIDTTDTVERNISSMDSEAGSRDDKQDQSSLERTRPANDYDEDEGVSGEGADSDEGEGQSINRARRRRPKRRSHRRDRGSPSRSTNWRPGVIDDEVSRIEADARDRERDKKESATSDDQSVGDETDSGGSNGSHGDEEHSQEPDDVTGDQSGEQSSESTQNSRKAFKIGLRHR